MKEPQIKEQFYSLDRTDEIRSKLKLNHVKGLFLDFETCEKLLLKDGIIEEVNNYRLSLNMHDAIRPYLLRTVGEHTSPFIFDCRRGAYPALIAYVNTGADDFNSATNWICPSAILACHFHETMLRNKYFKEQVETEHDETAKKEALQVYKLNCLVLNDLLYIYGRLKYSSRGLNTQMIEQANQKVHVDVKEGLKEMDALVDIPEKERFKSFEPQTIQKKSSFKDLSFDFLKKIFLHQR